MSPDDPSRAELSAPTRLRRPFGQTIFGDRVVVVHQTVIKPLGGFEEAGLFSQLAYWYSKALDRGELWAYRTQEQLERETGITPKRQRAIRAHLRELGVLHEERRGLPSQLYYQTDIPRLEQLISETWDETPEEPDGQENGGDSRYAEPDDLDSPKRHIKKVPNGTSSSAVPANLDSPKLPNKNVPNGASIYSRTYSGGSPNGDTARIDGENAPETIETAPETLPDELPVEPSPAPAAPEPAPSRKPLPRDTPAHCLVADFCALAGIEKPGNYKRALGQAKILVQNGVDETNLASLYAAADWGDGADLGRMIATLDRWKANRAKPRPLSVHLQARVDAWRAERIARELPLDELPATLQRDVDAWQEAVRRLDELGLPRELYDRAMTILTERSARTASVEPRPYFPLPTHLQNQVDAATARTRAIGAAR